MPDLPALPPEVWLHWDPKTVAERGPRALLTHRMDFLLLLQGGGRVVIEVDGAQHYSDATGRADPRQYEGRPWFEKKPPHPWQASDLAIIFSTPVFSFVPEGSYLVRKNSTLCPALTARFSQDGISPCPFQVSPSALR